MEAEVHQKRKYTKRKSLNVTAGETGVRLHGIKLEVDPDCIERMKNEQVAQREKEFRQAVLGKFETHIADLKEDVQRTGRVPESLELPATLETASADFSFTPTTERILVPGNDYAIRVHVGLMALMHWTTNHITAMQKEIQDLKSIAADIPTPIAVSVAEVSPVVAHSDKSTDGQAKPSEMFFTT